MSKFKIGVMTDSFKLSFKESVVKAREVGAQGIQLYAIEGEMAPENLNKQKVHEINDIIQSNGLIVSAVCGDFGGHGFEIESDNKWKIEKSKRIIDLALELGCHIVTTHAGVISPNVEDSRRQVMSAACEELGKYAEQSGAYFALETGPEPATVLKSFLAHMDTNGIRVNFDPANLIMVAGDDPVEGVRTLGKYIVHTHAKDGIMINKSDPRIIYDIFAQGGVENQKLDQFFKELPLGKGNVNFNAYLKALNDVGYDGFLTIEREVGANPEEDIRQAVTFLKQIIEDNF